MGIYGKVDLQSWQLTPMGVQRVQNGNLKGIGTPEKQVLKGLVRFGGVADTDELTTAGLVSPGIIGISLKRLVDRGLILPVGSPTELSTTVAPPTPR